MFRKLVGCSFIIAKFLSQLEPWSKSLMLIHTTCLLCSTSLFDIVSLHLYRCSRCLLGDCLLGQCYQLSSSAEVSCQSPIPMPFQLDSVQMYQDASMLKFADVHEVHAGLLMNYLLVVAYLDQFCQLLLVSGTLSAIAICSIKSF